MVIKNRKTVIDTSNSIESNTSENIVLDNTKKIFIISLPYKKEKFQNLTKSLNSTLGNVLHHRHVTKFMYTGKKLGSAFGKG